MKIRLIVLLIPMLVCALGLSFFACGDDDDDDDDGDNDDVDDDVDDDADDDADDDVDDDADDDVDDDFDCQEAYDNLLANQCIGYSSFEYYACTEDNITDPECYLACIALLEDGLWLCYEAEQCLFNCADDDATGCMNAYYGMPNEDCVDYQAYYRNACDPRITLDMRNCYTFCYENEEDCDGFVECVSGCEG